MYYYNQDEIRKKYFAHIERPHWLTQEILDEIKRNSPNTRHWVAAYNMATDYYDHPSEIDPQTGKGFQASADYEGMYEMTSHYVHVSAMSTQATFDASPFRTAERDHEEDRGILALHFSLVYLYEICIILGRQWECVLPPDVTENVAKLLKELRSLPSVTQQAAWAVGKSHS